MSTDALFSEELPADARALIEQAEHDLTEAEAQAETEIAEIQARADRLIAQARRAADEAAGEVRERAQRARSQRTRQLVESLRPLQVACVKEGLLDEALAIRDRVRQLRTRLLNARPDPGTLAERQPADEGTEVLFEVVGSTDGTVWGTDIYTTDSSLATAAVHAGLLRPGERGIVRASIVSGLNVAFTGSHRNGVWSEDFTDYSVGYRLSRA